MVLAITELVTAGIMGFYVSKNKQRKNAATTMILFKGFQRMMSLLGKDPTKNAKGITGLRVAHALKIFPDQYWSADKDLGVKNGGGFVFPNGTIFTNIEYANNHYTFKDVTYPERIL